MHRTFDVLLSAVTISIVAAFGLSGCGADRSADAPERPRTSASAPAPDAAPLPAPEALSTVLLRLADVAVPPPEKVGLLQYGTPDDEPVLRGFGDTLAANGYAPLSVEATNLAWAPQPGSVSATVTFSSPDPAVAPFTYPMEFAPSRNGWQLSRRTAEQILPLVSAGQTPPIPPPAPPR